MQLKRAPSARARRSRSPSAWRCAARRALLCPVAIAIAIAIAISLGSTPAAHADRRAEVGLAVYADDDDVTVVRPSALLAAPTGRAELTAEVVIDIVSAASVDLVSRASPRGFQETRVEPALTLSLPLSRLATLALRGFGSTEPDFDMLGASAGVSLDSASRADTVGLTYALSQAEVGRADDPGHRRGRTTMQLAASWTRVTDRAGYVDVVLEGELQVGALANPYRYVPIETSTGVHCCSVPERTPDLRATLAALLRVRRALAHDRLFLHADYRLAADGWGLTSHTVSARALMTVSPRAVLGASARGYLQSAADFHRTRYLGADTVPAYRTRDRNLGRERSASLGLACELALGDVPAADGAHLTAAATWLALLWPGDPLQQRRDALLATVSLEVPF
ncbi:MAG: DUF3570 domain-containing protein [Deltaproteobacteria bacterium]|nr:DUF3570 domain-containing protein [Deltaproteobacteria bacterium]